MLKQDSLTPTRSGPAAFSSRLLAAKLLLLSLPTCCHWRRRQSLDKHFVQKLAKHLFGIDVLVVSLQILLPPCLHLLRLLLSCCLLSHSYSLQLGFVLFLLLHVQYVSGTDAGWPRQLGKCKEEQVSPEEHQGHVELSLRQQPLSDLRHSQSKTELVLFILVCMQ